MINPEPKKSLGQHWLNDTASLNAVAETANIEAGDTVLEIGPGLGSLTKILLQKAGKVIAVELDDILAAKLQIDFPTDKLTVVKKDILTFDLTELPIGYKVVANIPYYLTSHLLRILNESSNPPSIISLLVQKEVAQRVCAAPGQMSMLSVSVQFYCETSLGIIIPAKLFTPPPKVDSQILKLVQRQKPLFPNIDSKRFFRIVKAGFANRRKTLLNSLSAGLQLSKDQTAQIITSAGLDSNSRPQELSLEQWFQLYKVVVKNDPTINT